VEEDIKGELKTKIAHEHWTHFFADDGSVKGDAQFMA
jgi:hypothetical protein